MSSPRSSSSFPETTALALQAARPNPVSPSRVPSRKDGKHESTSKFGWVGRRCAGALWDRIAHVYEARVRGHEGPNVPWRTEVHAGRTRAQLEDTSEPDLLRPEPDPRPRTRTARCVPVTTMANMSVTIRGCVPALYRTALHLAHWHTPPRRHACPGAHMQRDPEPAMVVSCMRPRRAVTMRDEMDTGLWRDLTYLWASASGAG
ncbi:hypothetical protein C2E23DRAFT_461855 [Lenzites betulinus]|nr:hypothetical protein C2E23DRAFT_461855 [Lenzites betulinus]